MNRSTDIPTPAQQLAGKKLSNGWKVEELIDRPETATGGCFSTSYIVRSSRGERAFLKAMDFRRALGAPDPSRALENMTASYNFERDLLEKCKSNDLSRIVKILDSGKLIPEEEDLSNVVQYLIFELADKDIRAVVDFGKNFETAWVLRTMHQTAAALQQLHSLDIAHQDVKPSNMLIFKDNHFKLADLGRASERHTTAPHDEFECAGDSTYAPPELLYGHTSPDWGVRRLGCDFYLLGSIVVFFCTAVSMTHLLLKRIDKEHHYMKYNGAYSDVLPYIQQVFTQIIREFREKIIRPDFAEDIAEIVTRLCNPDPNLRGHPKNIISGNNRYSLERYVSTFDLLAKRAEWKLTHKDPLRRSN